MRNDKAAEAGSRKPEAEAAAEADAGTTGISEDFGSCRERLRGGEAAPEPAEAERTVIRLFFVSEVKRKGD